MLSRIARIQIQLVQSWDVLSTMTPLDYAVSDLHDILNSGVWKDSRFEQRGPVT